MFRKKVPSIRIFKEKSRKNFLVFLRHDKFFQVKKQSLSKKIPRKAFSNKGSDRFFSNKDPTEKSKRVFARKTQNSFLRKDLDKYPQINIHMSLERKIQTNIFKENRTSFSLGKTQKSPFEWRIRTKDLDKSLQGNKQIRLLQEGVRQFFPRKDPDKSFQEPDNFSKERLRKVFLRTNSVRYS